MGLDIGYCRRYEITGSFIYERKNLRHQANRTLIAEMETRIIIYASVGEVTCLVASEQPVVPVTCMHKFICLVRWVTTMKNGR